MTLKLSPEERKKYTLERKRRNMKDYYNRRKEEHKENVEFKQMKDMKRTNNSEIYVIIKSNNDIYSKRNSKFYAQSIFFNYIF